MIAGAGLDESARERVVRDEKTPADREPERRVVPLTSGQSRLSSGKGCWRDQRLLDTAGAKRPELQDGWRSLAAADREFRGGPRSRPRLGGKVQDWKSAARVGPLRAFRIGAVFQKRVRRRSSCAGPVRGQSWARQLAVVGRKDDGKESVRCRNGPSHGPGYRQHRVPGIWGGSRGLFGGWKACSVTANAPSGERAAGVGLGLRQGGWDGISRESGVASRAPACNLWSVIAVTTSRSARTTRGMEMSNPYIAHSGEAGGARVHDHAAPVAQYLGAIDSPMVPAG